MGEDFYLGVERVGKRRDWGVRKRREYMGSIMGGGKKV